MCVCVHVCVCVCVCVCVRVHVCICVCMLACAYVDMTLCITPNVSNASSRRFDSILLSTVSLVRIALAAVYIP